MSTKHAKKMTKSPMYSYISLELAIQTYKEIKDHHVENKVFWRASKSNNYNHS